MAAAKRADTVPLTRELLPQCGELALSGIRPPTLGSDDCLDFFDGGSEFFDRRLESSDSLMLTRSNGSHIVEFSFEVGLPLAVLMLSRSRHDAQC